MAPKIVIAQSRVHVISVMPHESASSGRLPIHGLRCQKPAVPPPVLDLSGWGGVHHVVLGKESPRSVVQSHPQETISRRKAEKDRCCAQGL